MTLPSLISFSGYATVGKDAAADLLVSRARFVVDCREFVLSWFKQNSGQTTNKWPFVVTTARMKRTDREQKTLDRYVATVTNFDGSRILNAEISEYIHSKGYSGGIGA